MTTTEHLSRIRAKCVELLEIAEKRTPGKWQDDPEEGVYNASIRCGLSAPYTGDYLASVVKEQDARFIAACAGNFERALRSTIAAIDRNARMAEIMANIVIPSMADLAIKHELHQQACEILAAWPEETL